MALYKNRLILVLLLYAACYVLLYPFYQYIFDDDGIGYLMVVKHLSKGDFYNGINGYWSPLHSWLILPFYKAGINEFTAFKVSNGLIGAGILITINSLLNKTPVSLKGKFTALLVCIPIVLSYAFFEVGADILFCLLLLIFIHIITESDFFENRTKNVLCALVGGLCYFSKSYGFPFFFLSFTLVQLILYKKASRINKKRLLAMNLGIGYTIFLLLALPWIYTLYSKYHFITFGYSGRLNYEWTLYKSRATTTQLITAPPNNLLCLWEDPWYNPQQPIPYSSFFTFALKQLRVILKTFTDALSCYFEISFLAPAIILCSILYVIKTRDTRLTLLLLFVVLLPAGYLPVHIETRFLWPSTFLILLFGYILVYQGLQFMQPARYIRFLAWCLFFGSFLIQPVNQLKDKAGNDAAVFQLAAALQAKGVKGKLACSIENYSEAERVAYLTGNRFYSLTRVKYSYEELLAACRQYHIDYYFFYYKFPFELESFKQTIFYKSAKQEVITKNPNLLLLKMN
jgi:hypothetical protein